MLEDALPIYASSDHQKTNNQHSSDIGCSPAVWSILSQSQGGCEHSDPCYREEGAQEVELRQRLSIEVSDELLGIWWDCPQAATVKKA